MNHTKYRFNLDMQSNISQISLPMRQNDTGIVLRINLTDGGIPYTIKDGCMAWFFGRKSDGNTLIYPCSIENNTTICFEVTQQTTACLGIVDCEIRLYGSDENIITTPRFIVVVYARVMNDSEAVDSESDMAILDNILSTEAARVNNEILREQNHAKMLDTTDRATAAAEELERKLATGDFDGITPHVGANGNWWFEETDSGVIARGITPHIGANGHWWFNDIDSGVEADAGKHTHDSKDITGFLPIKKGGTGATTAEQALKNLGAQPKLTYYEGEFESSFERGGKMGSGAYYEKITASFVLPSKPVMIFFPSVGKPTYIAGVGENYVTGMYVENEMSSHPYNTITVEIEGNTYTFPKGATWGDVNNALETPFDIEVEEKTKTPCLVGHNKELISFTENGTKYLYVDAPLIDGKYYSLLQASSEDFKFVKDVVLSNANHEEIISKYQVLNSFTYEWHHDNGSYQDTTKYTPTYIGIKDNKDGTYTVNLLAEFYYSSLKHTSHIYKKYYAICEEVPSSSPVTFRIYARTGYDNFYDETYTVASDTTWAEWCDNSYNEGLGGYVWKVTASGNVQNSVSGFIIHDNSGNEVKGTDIIKSGLYTDGNNTPPSEEPETPSDTITVTINGSKYAIPNGATWGDLNKALETPYMEFEPNEGRIALMSDMGPVSHTETGNLVYVNDLLVDGESYTLNVDFIIAKDVVLPDQEPEEPEEPEEPDVPEEPDTPEGTDLVTFNIHVERGPASLDYADTVEKGTTWAEWCAKMNEAAIAAGVGEIWVNAGGYVSNNMDGFVVKDSNGNKVLWDSEIVSGEYVGE